MSRRKPHPTRRGRRDLLSTLLDAAAAKRGWTMDELVLHIVRRDLKPSEQLQLLREVGPEAIDEVVSFYERVRSGSISA